MVDLQTNSSPPEGVGGVGGGRLADGGGNEGRRRGLQLGKHAAPPC